MLSVMGRAPASFKVCSGFFLAQKDKVCFCVTIVRRNLFRSESHPERFAYKLCLSPADLQSVI